MEKGDLHIGFGIMGGLNQAQAHAQFVSNYGGSRNEYSDGAGGPALHQAQTFERLRLSRSRTAFRKRFARTLIGKGQQLDVRAIFSGSMGGGQAVMHDSATGVNYGASIPRKDGAAVPEPDPYFGK